MGKMPNELVVDEILTPAKTRKKRTETFKSDLVFPPANVLPFSQQGIYIMRKHMYLVLYVTRLYLSYVMALLLVQTTFCVA